MSGVNRRTGVETDIARLHFGQVGDGEPALGDECLEEGIGSLGNVIATDDFEAVRSTDEAQSATIGSDGHERHPGGDHRARSHWQAARILMPRRASAIRCLEHGVFDKDACAGRTHECRGDGAEPW